MALINLAKLGMELFLYLAVLAVGSMTLRPDLAFCLVAKVNIWLCAGCFTVFRANLLDSTSRLLANGSRLSMAKLQK